MKVIVIGAGVTGCAIARELCRSQYEVTVLEKASDLCEGTSKANSGIVHAGFDAVPGSLMARLNVRGSELMEPLSRELDFAYRRNGAFVLCFEKENEPRLQELKERGEKNGVKGLRILTGDEVRAMEPQVSDKVTAALRAPTSGIVCPFELTIALGENAAVNGADFRFNTAVTGIRRKDNGWTLETSKGEFEADIVINAAGVYADRIHNMVSEEKMEIIPRKGEYCLMDKKLGGLVDSTLFQLPTQYGKGVLVTPTVHGNLMVGPTAVDIPDKENTATTAEGMAELLQRGAKSVKNLPLNQIITSFTGLRAHESHDDFIIGEAAGAPGFIDAAGIASPGLSSAPAIGEYVAEIVQSIAPAEKKENFIGARTGIPHVAGMSPEALHALIEKDPAFAHVICRCERVTEGEILAAIHRPLGATTLDGVKRRTRAGMGRCQAGFCSPSVVEILARELGKDPGEITKAGGESRFITGYDKEGLA